MKIYESAEVLGTLKIRRGLVDRVLTDGGFYSSQFGEVAYKTDLSQQGGGESSVFYGIVVKHTNSSYPARNVSVVSFADEFYLTQNAPNTDEVTVSLASKGTLVLNRERTILRRDSTTTAARIVDVVIPSGALGTNGCVRGWTFGQFQSAAARTFQIVAALNGVTIFQDNTVAHGGNAGIKPWQIEWIFGQRQSTTLAFFQGTMFVGGPKPAGTIAGEGDFDGGLTHQPIFGNTAVTDNSAISQRLTIDLNMTAAAAGADFYRHFAYSEML